MTHETRVNSAPHKSTMLPSVRTWFAVTAFALAASACMPVGQEISDGQGHTYQMFPVDESTRPGVAYVVSAADVGNQGDLGTVMNALDPIDPWGCVLETVKVNHGRIIFEENNPASSVPTGVLDIPHVPACNLSENSGSPSDNIPTQQASETIQENSADGIGSVQSDVVSTDSESDGPTDPVATEIPQRNKLENSGSISQTYMPLLFGSGLLLFCGVPILGSAAVLFGRRPRQGVGGFLSTSGTTSDEGMRRSPLQPLRVRPYSEVAPPDESGVKVVEVPIIDFTDSPYQAEIGAYALANYLERLPHGGRLNSTSEDLRDTQRHERDHAHAYLTQPEQKVRYVVGFRRGKFGEIASYKPLYVETQSLNPIDTPERDIAISLAPEIPSASDVHDAAAAARAIKKDEK